MLKQDMPAQFIVFTDMDGTLIDHFDYSFDAAKPALARLQERDITVIPNTSKTAAELAKLRVDIGLNGPYIVENGAALLIPKAHITLDTNTINQFELQENEDSYVKAFSRSRSVFLSLIDKIPKTFDGHYQCFSQMDAARVSELTGLNTEDANLALQRDYSEPIAWLSDDPALKTAFIKALADIGGRVLEGGRFLHFADASDKGKAMCFCTALFDHINECEHKSIALGDGNNDIDMLEQSDIAVAIKSPVHPALKLKRSKNLIHTRLTGPAGWTEAINSIIL